MSACLLPACNPRGGSTDESEEGPDAAAGARSDATGTFVSLSDLHFDPFYDPSLFADLMATEAPGWQEVFESSSVTDLAPAGHDSGYELFASVLRAAHDAASDPDFVVYSGDFLAHGFEKTFADALAGLPAGEEPAAADCRSAGRPAVQCFIDRTIEFGARMLRASFGEAPVYPVLGNNDSYCGDYQVDPTGPFVQRTGATWSRELIDAGNRAGFDATFGDGAYYVVSPPGSGGRILALNTNLYSSRYHDACAEKDERERPQVELLEGAPPEAAATQMRWLGDQLAQAESVGEGTLLLYHIPVGIDVYATLSHGDAGSANEVVSFWRREHVPEFLDVVAAHGGTIRAALAGHTHMDQYILASEAGAGATFEHVTPGVSPLFGNNPAFEVFTYDRGTMALVDYTKLYLPVAGANAERPPAWQPEYRFSEAYELSSISASTLADLWPRLRDAGSARSSYERYFSAGNEAGTKTFSDATRPAYWCAIGNAAASDFAACVANPGGGSR